MKRIFPIIFLSSFFILFDSQVYACLCEPMSVKKRVNIMKKEADAIFIGTVKSINIETLRNRKLVIEVKKSWKDKNIKEYVIYTSGGCYVGFKEGEMYLVYAKYNEKKELFTEICWGTGTFELSNKDIKMLGKPTFININ